MSLYALADAYLEHLSGEDLALLLGDRRIASRVGTAQEFLASHPGGFDEVLSQPRVFESVLASTSGDPLRAASPFLVFAVAVHRAGAELGSTSYVSEWLGPGRRTPLFDVDQLREFMSAPWRRFFLAELLASYTHVASGSVIVPTRRGLKRHRFSELDPVRLAGLLDVVSEAERPGILRRLGDLALFLTGVFPDYVGRRGFGPIEEGRLLRSTANAEGPGSPTVPSAASGLGDTGAVGMLEELGRRWYRAAYDLLPGPVSDRVAVVGELASRFGQARRILGFVTERFVFANREGWLGLGGR